MSHKGSWGGGWGGPRSGWSQQLGQNLLPAPAPSRGGSSQENETATLNSNLDFSPKTTIECNRQQSSGLRREGGEGREKPWTWQHYKDNTDIAKTPLGAGEKRFYEKFSHKKSRSCIELSDRTLSNVWPSRHTTRGARRRRLKRSPQHPLTPSPRTQGGQTNLRDQ